MKRKGEPGPHPRGTAVLLRRPPCLVGRRHAERTARIGCYGLHVLPLLLAVIKEHGGLHRKMCDFPPYVPSKPPARKGRVSQNRAGGVPEGKAPFRRFKSADFLSTENVVPRRAVTRDHFGYY